MKAGKQLDDTQLEAHRLPSFLDPLYVQSSRLLCAFTLLLIAIASPAFAEASGYGPYQSEVFDYDGGVLPLPFKVSQQDKVDDKSVDIRLNGRLYMPSGSFSSSDYPWPIVVIIPARHATCQSSDGSEFTPKSESVDAPKFCSDNTAAGTSRIRPDLGYDYLGRALASFGIAVVAIDTSDIRAIDTFATDGGDGGRLRLAFAHLDLLRRVANGMSTLAPFNDRIAGKIDFTRIGLLGHSRGGIAVSNALRDSRARTGFQYDIRGIFQLAAGGGAYAFGSDGLTLPVDDESFMRVVDVPLAGLSGDCDGDGSNAGFVTFARSKYASKSDEAPKYYFRLSGANHNFFNQVFTTDDADESYGNKDDASYSAACDSRAPSTLRLERHDQQRLAQAYVTGFFRKTLLEDHSVDAFLSGESSLPRSLCPAHARRPCEEIVNVSYVPPASDRKLILEPGSGDPVGRSSLGTMVSANGFDYLDWCEPSGRVPLEFQDAASFPTVRRRQSILIPYFARRPCKNFPEAFGSDVKSADNQFLQTTDRQLEIAWSHPAHLTIETGAGGIDVSRFSSLRFRAFANYLARQSPQPDRAQPRSAAKVEVGFDVTMTDGRGRHATVHVSDFTESALSVPFRSVPVKGTMGNLVKLTLGGVRIPLTAFSKIDLASVSSIRLDFGSDGTPRGMIHLSDLLFDRSH